MYTSTKRTRETQKLHLVNSIIDLQESAYKTNFIKAIDKNIQFILILRSHSDIILKLLENLF